MEDISRMKTIHYAKVFLQSQTTQLFTKLRSVCKMKKTMSFTCLSLVWWHLPSAPHSDGEKRECGAEGREDSKCVQKLTKNNKNHQKVPKNRWVFPTFSVLPSILHLESRLRRHTPCGCNPAPKERILWILAKIYWFWNIVPEYSSETAAIQKFSM